MKKIVSFDYNWFCSTEVGEEYTTISMNERIKEMKYHQPTVEDNRHYIDIHYKNGKSERIFNINKIVVKEELK